ncbi:MAG: polysaccharide deacetylase family protein [Bacillota bacterium]
MNFYRTSARDDPLPSPCFYRDKAVVLVFHNISDVYHGRGTISPEAFASDIEALLANGFHIIPVNRLLAFLKGKTELPPNAVVITFDDGYAGVYRYAYPVLQKHRVPATVFLIAGYIGKKADFLNWRQVREMADSGLFTFGGHTYEAHYVVPTGLKTAAPATVARIYNPRTGQKETAPAYRARMLADSIRAQETFSRELGFTTLYFAYPYGAFTPELDQVLRVAGYRYFFTIVSGSNHPGQDPAHLYRINAGMPWITPEELVATIRYVASHSNFPRRIPSGWLPRWAEDPALYSPAIRVPPYTKNGEFLE